MNRLALLRYSILDACFSAPEGTPRERMTRGRQASGEPGGNTLMFKEDLLDLVNRRLQEAVPGTKPIAMRTLEKDLVDMQRLYGVKIVKHSLHKRAWYSYASSGMTIRKGKLTSSEMARLEGALAILARFYETPGYEWLRFANGRIRFAFGMVAPSRARGTKPESDGGRWLDGGEAGPPSDVMEALLLGLATGTWMNATWGGETRCMRLEALADEGSALVGAGTIEVAGGFSTEVFALSEVTDVEARDVVPASAPAPFAWSFPLRGASTDVPVAGDVGERVEMRIWFAMDALSACDHAPFPGDLLCKPEAAAGGQILTYALVPGDAWARRLWSFGPSAQLLEPVELRMQLASQVEQMRAGYAKLFGP